MNDLSVAALSLELLDALDQARLVTPPTQRWPDFDFTMAYRVARDTQKRRRDRGEQPVGRKIGYTNRAIWAHYHMSQPIWDHVYTHTVRLAPGNAAEVSISGMVAPRIEPEIAFKLQAPLHAGSHDPAEILRSVEYVARAFEIVDCHYADWQFIGPDSVADFSHHAALIVGEPMPILERDIAGLADALRDCRVNLIADGEIVDTGVGSNALGNPVLALAFLVDVLASQEDAPPLAAGEIITTGTLTALRPVHAGETWRSETEGIDLPPLTVRFLAAGTRTGSPNL